MVQEDTPPQSTGLAASLVIRAGPAGLMVTGSRLYTGSINFEFGTDQWKHLDNSEVIDTFLVKREIGSCEPPPAEADQPAYEPHAPEHYDISDGGGLSATYSDDNGSVEELYSDTVDFTIVRSLPPVRGRLGKDVCPHGRDLLKGGFFHEELNDDVGHQVVDSGGYDSDDVNHRSPSGMELNMEAGN